MLRPVPPPQYMYPPLPLSFPLNVLPLYVMSTASDSVTWRASVAFYGEYWRRDAVRSVNAARIWRILIKKIPFFNLSYTLCFATLLKTIAAKYMHTHTHTHAGASLNRHFPSSLCVPQPCRDKKNPPKSGTRTGTTRARTLKGFLLYLVTSEPKLFSSTSFLPPPPTCTLPQSPCPSTVY